ncbi:MAG: MMPL family transporter [Candidatus Onthomonas sp.]|nr:MMPL family transporter [Candidatus Onthomonas sp.]
MRRFYEQVVKRPKLIVTVFLLLVVLSAVCRQFVAVNYDMNDYLPQDSASTVGLDKLEEEYEGGIPNARVMVQEVTVPEALEYKERLLRVDGVTDVTWLDDVIDVTQPLEMADADDVETYYQDEAALFSVTIDEEKCLDAVSEIRDIIGDDNAMTGSAVSTAVATTSTISEIAKIASFAVLFVLFVLVVTTTSWAEPLIILAGVGVAVVINAGSNLIFGEISFVTNSAGSILQLAVSLDYSVFLLHRFEECRRETPDVRAAMADALTMSTGSVLSSGLTTVIGFLALCLMKFRIGPDLGLALAKGIAISLISVFTFLPALILLTYRLIDRSRHRSFMPSFQGFGRFVSRVMIPMACVFALLIVPSYLASNSNSFYYGSSHIFGAGTQLGDDTAAIEDAFGKNDTYVLMVPKESTATQRELSDALHRLPEVKSILSYVDTVGVEIPEEYLDSGTLSQLNSERYTRMMLSVDVPYESEETFDLVEQIRAVAERYYPGSWYLAGQGVSTYDLMETITADTVKVNLVAIGAVFVVLLLTMKSLSLPVILVLSIETAIWINLSVPYFTDSTIFYIAYLIISSVQLGATVDYAILLTDRYREYRQDRDKKEAVVSTISTVTVSILTSASALTVVGFLLGYFSTHGLLSQLGYFLGKGTLCSLVIVLFVLPGLLYLFDRVVMRRHRAVLPKKYGEVS